MSEHQPLRGRRFCVVEETYEWHEFLITLGATIVDLAAASDDTYMLVDFRSEEYPFELQLSTMWLRYQCARAHQWQRPDVSPLFRPLPSRDGIATMRSLVITLSGISRAEEEHAQALIAVCGAALRLGLQPGRTTHLVCADESKKAAKRSKLLRSADRLNRDAKSSSKIHLVSLTWLFECVRQWRRVRELQYAVQVPETKSRFKPLEPSRTNERHSREQRWKTDDDEQTLSDESSKASDGEAAARAETDTEDGGTAPRRFFGRHVSPYFDSNANANGNESVTTPCC